MWVFLWWIHFRFWFFSYLLGFFLFFLECQLCRAVAIPKFQGRAPSLPIWNSLLHLTTIKSSITLSRLRCFNLQNFVVVCSDVNFKARKLNKRIFRQHNMQLSGSINRINSDFAFRSKSLSAPVASADEAFKVEIQQFWLQFQFWFLSITHFGASIFEIEHHLLIMISQLNKGYADPYGDVTNSFFLHTPFFLFYPPHFSLWKSFL